MASLEPYSKKLDYSYCLGLFPSLTLMESRPDAALRLLLHPAGDGNEGVEKLKRVCREHGVRSEYAEKVLRRESKKDNCFAALVFKKYYGDLDAGRDHVVLNAISDGGNLGTCIRSLLGFGFKDIAVIRPCVDVFDPHVLRASMGAFFKTRLRVFDSFDDYRALYPAHALYPFMLDGAIEAQQAAEHKKRPFSLVFGNEASGLPPEFAKMGQSVIIPQSDEIDSLNLSAAVSIGAYIFSRG